MTAPDPIIPRDISGIRQEILIIRDDPKTKPAATCDQISRIIRIDLGAHGHFYYNDDTQFYLKAETGVLYRIDNDSMKSLLYDYGLNAIDTHYRYVVEDLREYAQRHGTKTEVHLDFYYNNKTFTVYWFDQQFHMIVITPDAPPRLELNGTDGVLFLKTPGNEPITLGPKPDGDTRLLKSYIIDTIPFDSDGISLEQLRFLFDYWFHTLFFESIMLTKPILTIVGPKGSGKSNTLRRIGVLLFGSKFNVSAMTSEEKDFDAAVTNSSFIAIDNLDSSHKWFADKIASIATGSYIEKRELYTTNTLHRVPIHCSVAITSRDPKFKRDDVVSRLLIMNVKGLEGYRSEYSLIAEILEHRNEILNDIIWNEIPQCLKALRDTPVSIPHRYRLADFANFCLAIGKSAGEEDYADTVAMLDASLSEQEAMTAEGEEVLIDLIIRWKTKYPNAKPIKSSDLLVDLQKIAKDLNIKLFVNSPKQLSRKLSILKPILNKQYGSIVCGYIAGPRANVHLWSFGDALLDSNSVKSEELKWN